MQKAFTMIELVFVIVIIGILSAVAMPKLSGTHNEAKTAVAIANLTTCLKDAGSSYLGTNTFDDNTVACNDIKTGVSTGCWTLTSSTSGDYNITNIIPAPPATLRSWCTAAQTIAGNRDLNGTHSFGGIKITY